MFGSSALQQRAVEEEKPAAPRAPQLVREPTPEPAADLAAVQQVNARDQEEAAKETAERAALDALRQWREAQEKLRQLARERSAKEAAEQAELEARQRAAKAARAPVKGEPPKRAVAAKEGPKPVSKETSAMPSGVQGIVVETTKADAAKAATQKPAQQPTARRPEAPARTSKTGSAEASKTESPRRAEAAGGIASDQVWDCVPRPPDNKIICHPIPNRP